MSKDLTGILLIDKPKGITSFGVLNKIKKRFGIKKIGHAGTLDPDATGLLIVLLGYATKLQGLITDERKTYSGEIILGVSTSTDDTTGDVIHQEKVPEISKEKLDSVVSTFLGEHLQRPPIFSAIKKDGVRAYKLARRGDTVQLDERLVTLFSAGVEIISEDRLFYRVSCSKGFYVRSFARDLAIKLGTCGVTNSIRREFLAGVTIFDAIKLEELLDLEALPVVEIVDFFTSLEKIKCSDEEYLRLISGQGDVIKELEKRIVSNEEVLLVLPNDSFIGVLKAKNKGIRTVRFLVPPTSKCHGNYTTVSLNVIKSNS